MRARLARPRRIVRGRLVAPVATAAAVALVAGVVVATPDAPTLRSDVQTVALEAPSGKVGASVSFNLAELVSVGEWAGIVITKVEGLPEGLTYADGVISGTATASGVYNLQVHGTVNEVPKVVDVTLVVNNADGSAPAGAEGGSTAAIEGSLGGEAQAGGQITTGSDGADAILGAVVGIVGAFGGDGASVAELAAGSTGQGGADTDTPDNSDTPTGPLASLTDGELGLGSLSSGGPDDTDTPEGDTPGTPGSDSLGLPGSTGGATGEATGGLNTESLGPLAPMGSLITGETTGETTTGSTTGTETGPLGSLSDSETTTGGEGTTGGEITIPGSTTTGDTGSLGDLAPGFAITGMTLLGLAGLTLLLNGGSSTPGSTAILPALPGSTGTGGANGGSSGSTGPNGTTTGGNNGGSSGSTAPTVAAGAPKPAQAPGPTVANGRG